MLINELFTQRYSWKWDEQLPYLRSAIFRADNDLEFMVHISKDDEERIPTWWVEFGVWGDSDEIPDPYKLTQAGNAPQIFSTVLDIIKNFRQSNPHTMLRFAAKEPSRISLYKRMAKRLATSVHTYVDGATGQTIFTIF
jgi:hypothetical protein